MTYGYDDHAPIPTRSRSDRIMVWGLGSVLTVVGVVSAIYLAGQYQAAAPWRAAQASERLREQAERDAEVARRAAATDAALNPPVAVVSTPAPDFDAMSQAELRRYFEQNGGGRTVAPVTTPTRAPRSEPVSGPLEWAVRPQWPALRDYAFPEGVTRISVQFRCQVSRAGALSGCVAVETPAGTGLGARMRPALADARLVPMTSNGRAVDGEATVSVAFAARPSVPVAVDRPKPPVEPAAALPDAPPKADAPPEAPVEG